MYLHYKYMRNAIHEKRSGQRGVALVIVLSMLVLLAGLVVAYFSRAVEQRKVSSNSSESVSADLFAQGALEYVITDLKKEIVEGSEAVPAGEVTVFVPTRQDGGATFGDAYPTIVPYRNAGTAGKNLIKSSLSGVAFHEGSLFANNGVARASDVDTTALSPNGRSISREQWNLPQLLNETEAENVPTPDWIYVNRSGANPQAFSDALANSNVGNSEFVLGRFAYHIYDVGGLMDINVAGNSLPEEENRRRGRLHQVNLEALTDASGPLVEDAETLVKWRWPQTNAELSDVPGDNGLFDPLRDFIQVPSGEQAFINRQDFLAYVKANPDVVREEALPFLTTFSRDVNAPMWIPESTRSKTRDDFETLEFEDSDPDPLADGMNVSLFATNVRFADETTITRGTEDPITVPAGTPVMFRRFPLTKLNLLSDPDAEPADILYYFGLQKLPSGAYEYVQRPPDNSTRIARLNEVAEQGREPNLIEILQAIIYTGSLGKTGGLSSLQVDRDLDSQQNYQVIQIAANLIDQWDEDDIPTTIQYLSFEAFGVENLPYINTVAVHPLVNTVNPERFDVWMLFDLWNPHMNARTLPNGISGFQIVPVDGRCSATAYYYLSVPTGGGNSTAYAPLAATIAGGGTKQDLVDYDISDGNPLWAPANVYYDQPTTIGNANPDVTPFQPGILLTYGNLGPAVPAEADRSAALKKSLNSLLEQTVEEWFPPDIEPPIDPSGTGTDDEWIYPEPIQITKNEDHYVLDATKTRLSMKFGVKSYNYVVPSVQSPLTFLLQANVPGRGWVTYQKVEGYRNYFSNSVGGRQSATSNTRTYRDENNVSQTAYIGTQYDTHHSVMPVEDIRDHYYRYRHYHDVWATNTWTKFDPRSRRFGMSGFVGDGMGAATRNTIQNIGQYWNGGLGTPRTTTTGGLNKTRYNWMGMYGGSGWIPGVETAGLKTMGYVPSSYTIDLNKEIYGFEIWPQYTATSNPMRKMIVPAASAQNDPRTPVGLGNPMRYKDPDGVIRPGDYYLGEYPMVVDESTAGIRRAERPVILNRPFRNVGELGYVFRDVPWKTLDFFSQYSADAGLLEVFSLDESIDSTPMVAGKVNLNTPHPEILRAILQGAQRHLNGLDGVVDNFRSGEEAFDATTATAIAQAIVTESQATPLFSKAELVYRIMDEEDGAANLTSTNKAMREGVVRALSDTTTTRTWNLMVDIVAQTGIFPGHADELNDFVPRGQRRYWVHLAIDRMTGNIVDQVVEVVHE